ncbi:hypothetical protein [Moorena sp. SIO4G3]|uniref:hypothetical protein n=1 Tax=Moorena sp. SIO4G3 TaxID=2607821 RepID=UPI00142A0F00|nr:hypothetical protein [Moorena sp. SIO4G3]NEO79974.1 hypothetical protein [Moorena sp. SIO4G3]
MKRNQLWLIGLTLLTTLLLIIGGRTPGSKPEQLTIPIQSLPAQAQLSALAAPTTADTSAHTLRLNQEPYKDLTKRFQVGILEGYKVSTIAGFPLMEAPDGNLAYTVLVEQRATDRPLSNPSLAQIAIEQFRRGEGFQTANFQPVPGGVSLPWRGSLTLGGQTQPVSGVILARQLGKNVVVMLICATESAQGDVKDAITLLANTLKPL